MKAITLWQPWASLIAIGAKPYETRSWAPPASLIGQRIAIHAAAKPVPSYFDPETADAITEAFGRCGWNYWLPRSAVVCTAVLTGAFKCGSLAEGTARPAARVMHRITSRPFPDCFTVRIDEFGDYSFGRWAWLLEDVQRFDPPVPSKGKQGLWDWRVPEKGAAA